MSWVLVAYLGIAALICFIETTVAYTFQENSKKTTRKIFKISFFWVFYLFRWAVKGK